MVPGTPDEIIWARWRVGRDGRVDMVATRRSTEGFDRVELSFESIDEAGDALGPSFKKVVEDCLEAGSASGRWRP